MDTARTLTLDEFKKMLNWVQAQCLKIRKELDALDNKETIVEDLEGQIERLKKALALGMESLDDGAITRYFVDNYIF